MTLMHRIDKCASAPGLQHLWERIHMEDMLSRVTKWCKSQYFLHLYPGCGDLCVRTAVVYAAGYFGGAADVMMDEDFRCTVLLSLLVFAMAIAAYSWEVSRMLL